LEDVKAALSRLDPRFVCSLEKGSPWLAPLRKVVPPSLQEVLCDGTPKDHHVLAMDSTCVASLAAKDTWLMVALVILCLGVGEGIYLTTYWGKRLALFTPSAWACFLRLVKKVPPLPRAVRIPQISRLPRASDRSVSPPPPTVVAVYGEAAQTDAP
jgi:hypothetical protein